MIRVLSVTILLAFTSLCWSTPIVFTHSVIASGSLEGVPFSDIAVTITGLGDTSNRLFNGTNITLDLTSASVSLQNIGIFDFTAPLLENVNFTDTAPNDIPIVGLSRGPIIGLDLLSGPSDDAVKGWDMTTSIGPLVGQGQILQWVPPLFPHPWPDGVATTGGHLILNDATTAVTFSATIIPEPATFALLIAGVLPILLAHCRPTAHNRV